MNELFKEIVLPSLVKDVQEIFWDHIDPYGFPAYKETPLRIVRVSPLDEKHTAMRSIVEKYPFLVNHLLIFKVGTGHATGIHKDGNVTDIERHRSCNIPIAGCSSNGITEFFNVEEQDLKFDDFRKARFLLNNKPYAKIAEYTLLDNPVLCNTQNAHRVNNILGNDTRVTVSWTLSKRWTFNAIQDLINSGKYS